jgi:hypothetical protein
MRTSGNGPHITADRRGAAWYSEPARPVYDRSVLWQRHLIEPELPTAMVPEDVRGIEA